ncbi:MAG: phosphoadenylyl-sulfate reductase [Gammaproteobacteria bacterium]|nr:phosphoadenylyl-sulfate reductase [Gammaproteobacteria bacterium]
MDIEALNAQLQSLSAEARIQTLAEQFGGVWAFSSSFGLEDQALTELLLSSSLPNVNLRLITLDTGRLFAQTYQTWANTEAHFGRFFEAFYPEAEPLREWVQQNGINGFYQSKSQRLECCQLRKVEPLARALAGSDVWVTGLRAAQSHSRSQLPIVEQVEGRLKFNPIADWSLERVQSQVVLSAVPYNPLHDEGFPSIGCEPCTRRITQGESLRAGRWWWESAGAQECGLHLSKTGSDQ